MPGYTLGVAAFESRNFRQHGHLVTGCDVIVCWRHNLARCRRTEYLVTLERPTNSRIDGVGPSCFAIVAMDSRMRCLSGIFEVDSQEGRRRERV
jgi:hypothetical protein